jgi:hypothetical protein
MTSDTLTDRDIAHRHEFAEYATRHSDDRFHRPVLERLYRHWVSINRDHFAGACIEPTLDLKEPRSARVEGEWYPVGGHGQPGAIYVRPSLVTGKHPQLKEGDEYAEGRMLYVEDVLLHESVHQYCEEVLHDEEKSYKGHGPTFAGECNRIGQALGLAQVRPAKARGPLKELPSCAQWPHNVRPPDYYQGALAEPEPPAAEAEAPAEPAATFPCPLDDQEALPVIEVHFDLARLVPLGAGIIGLAARRLIEGGTDPAKLAAKTAEAVHRAIMRHAVSADGDKPKAKGRRPKAKGVTQIEIELPPPPKAKEGRHVSADGDKVPAGGDTASPRFAVGQKVRWIADDPLPPGTQDGIVEAVELLSRGPRLRILWNTGRAMTLDVPEGCPAKVEVIAADQAGPQPTNRSFADAFAEEQRVRWIGPEDGKRRPGDTGTIGICKPAADGSAVRLFIRWDGGPQQILKESQGEPARVEVIPADEPKPKKGRRVSTGGDEGGRSRKGITPISGEVSKV